MFILVLNTNIINVNLLYPLPPICSNAKGGYGVQKSCIFFNAKIYFMYSLLNDCKKAIKKTANIQLVEERMEAINKCLEGYGVESIDREKYVNGYWGNCCALYVNMGDTYTPTVIYNAITGKYAATCWGDFVEKYQTKYGII